MITRAIKVAIIKATSFNKSNNDNKTEFCMVKVSYLKLFPVATKEVCKMSVRY